MVRAVCHAGADGTLILRQHSIGDATQVPEPATVCAMACNWDGAVIALVVEAAAMSARPRSARPGFQVLNVLAGVVGLSLLHSCASPGHHDRFGGRFAHDPPMPPPVLDTVRVHELRGSATVQSGTRRLPLKADVEIHENQPVQVGSRSNLRLALGQRAVLDLGPNSRLVVHKLPRDGRGEERATWLRLEQGYLRVLWSDDRGDTPMELSFGRWAARIGAGEHFFDSSDNRASACSTSGAMTLSGVPEWTPRSLSEPCVTLAAHHAPVEIALREKDWDTVRTKRRLQPTLAQAARKQANEAVARLNRDGISAVAWKPATTRGAFTAERLLDDAPSKSVTYFPHTPPVIQIPAAPQPEEQLATVPDAPHLVYTQPEPADVISPDDVPAVTMDTPVETAPVTVATAATLMESDPPAAGVVPPTLKWTEDLHTDTSSLQPVTAATPVPTVAPVDTGTAMPAASAEPAVVAIPVTSAPATSDVSDAPQGDVALAVPATHALPPLPADGSGAEWIVNVATYVEPDMARHHAEQLIALGYQATVRPETVRGRSSYRVVIEGLPTEAAAQSAVADLGTRHGVRSAWAMRKR